MNATCIVFKQIQCWAKRCQPVIAEGKKGGDREEEIQNSHSTPWIVHTDSSFICNSFRVGNVGCWWGCAPSPSSSALQPE